jgi:16S rRNA (guanine1207-N2)-methyltransferase
MTASRLTLALETGAFVLPPEGTILVLRPRADTDLSALPAERVVAVQGFRPDHDALAARGYVTATGVPPAPAAAAVVILPRSKAEARSLVAAAAVVVAPGGPIVVDGQKTDGADAMLKDLRARVDLGEALAKAHGKLAVFANPGPAAFADWAIAPTRLPDGRVTHPAAFSADGIDKGSAALAAALPAKLPRRVADLGAGWGYLAAEVLARVGVEEVHLVEAEQAALEAARANITDPRARFHWADVTREVVPGAPFDAVVMNPPFHHGRAADPGLGRAFIAAAARALTPSGTLYMVANRHLPYERALAEHFREVEDLAPGAGAAAGAFKLIRAAGPIRAVPAKMRPKVITRARR